MLRIKRTKIGKNARTGEDLPETTHYAAAVDAGGRIGGWSASAPSAVAVTEAIAKRVSEFYASRPNVGVLTFEKVSATATQLAAAVVSEDAVGAAEFASLQEECRRLEAENREARKAAADWGKAMDQARSIAEQATAKVHGLEEALSGKSNEVAALRAKLSDLEAAAEAAKAAAPAPAVTTAVPVPQPATHGGKRK